MSEKINIIERRSAMYTTHYINGCVARIIEGLSEDVVVMDLIYRSAMAGEPIKATVTDDGFIEREPSKRMVACEILVGIAATKADWRRIGKLIKEEFGEDDTDVPEPAEPENA